MTDLRLPFRSLRKNSSTTLVVITTLAAAIGAATVIFSTIELVWRLVPIADRDRFVFVSSTDTAQVGATAGAVRRAGVSIPDLADWSAGSTSFEAFTALTTGTATLSGVDLPVAVSTARVSTNLLPLWGITPQLGRTFRAADATSSAEGPVVLLARRFWERQFSASAGVLGQNVRLNGQPHTIVGVLPATISVGMFRDVDVFVPLNLEAANAARDDRSLFVIARLKPGVQRSQASAELQAIASRLQVEHPTTNARISALVDPLIEASGMSVRLLLSILALVAALLLAMACANVSNITIAQNLARRHELAVRAALGGSRFDRLEPLMLEHAVVSIVAGVLGVVLAIWGVGLMRRFAPEAFGFGEMTVGLRALAATIVVSLLAPLAFGLLPSWRAAEGRFDSLRESSRTVTAPRRTLIAQRLLTGFQVALAVIITIQITVLSLAAWRLSTSDSGFAPDRLLTFRLELPTQWSSEPQRGARFIDGVVTALESLPGVEAAGTIDRLPIAESEAIGPLLVEGASDVPAAERPIAARAAISDNYLHTMRIPVVRGRSFTDGEVRGGARVAVVNQELVRRYFPARDPLGRRVAIAPVADDGGWLTVVGVVGNVRNSDVDQGALPEVYVPASPEAGASIAFALRTSSDDPLTVLPAVRSMVARLEGDQALLDVASMRQVLSDDVVGTMALTAILGIVGIVALCLAASGIYGVTAFAVGQRTPEIGFRIALGAAPGSVVRMILRQASVPVIRGAGVGVFVAGILSSQFTLIEDRGLREPLLFVVIVAGLLMVATLASYIPARRAARVDPMTALRSE